MAASVWRILLLRAFGCISNASKINNSLLEGEGTIRLDGRRYDFVQDSVALIVPHSNHSVFSESRLTLLVLAFEETALDASARSGLLHSRFISSVFLQLNPFAAADLRQLLRKMLFEQTHQDELYQWAMQIYMLEILLSAPASPSS